MSYILDALKKSERDRGTAIPAGGRGGAGGEAQEVISAWPLFALAAGLVAFGAGAAWFLLAGRAQTAPAALPAAALPAITEAASPGRDLVSETRVAAPPVAVISTTTRPPAARTQPAPTAEVPFLRSLPDEVRRSLPEMTVNIHVYTPDESRRMLYINNHEYRRGEFVDSVMIEDIVPDGVLMNYHGLRFKLERPR